MGDRAEAPVGVMSQILSMKSLNSCRCEERKVFIGSIQCSLAPKVIMLARPWRDLAIRVNVRRARGAGWSVCRVSRCPLRAVKSVTE